MRRSLRLVVRITVLVVAAGLASRVGLLPTSVGAADNSQAGGTLIVGFVPDPTAPEFDPQQSATVGLTEVLRRCFLRTLLGFTDLPIEKGGAVLRPDLATELPDVSSDGLIWTFHMKPGLHYAPPFDDVEIRSHDIVRALERTALVEHATYASYFSIVEGFDAFSSRDAASIAGLETPGDYTLRVHLRSPSGDFGFRMSLATTAPIPPVGDEPLGAAAGHDADYGPYLIPSGPYMWEETLKREPGLPPADQEPFWTLEEDTWNWVRNPSWDPETDHLRPAIPDKIEVVLEVPSDGVNSAQYNEARDEVDRWVRASIVDLDLLGIRDLKTAGLWRNDPVLKPRLKIVQDGGVFKYLAMNIAVPPLDDLHVRRAIGYAIDRERFNASQTRQDLGFPSATHLANDSLEGALLDQYNPYASTSKLDARKAAQEEMRKSAYDIDANGVCDDPSCLGLTFPALGLPRPLVPALKALVKPLNAIGITVRFVTFSPRLFLPKHQTPFLPFFWAPDFANASSVFGPLLTSAGIGFSNLSLTGATPEELSDWGYTVDEVPSVDERIRRCEVLEGQPQTWCWAKLDQFAMERLVAVLPLHGDGSYLGTSPYVLELTQCPSGIAAFDRVVVDRP